MPTRLLVFASFVLFASTCNVLVLNAQEDTSVSQTANDNNDNTVGGTVVSATRNTLVVRTAAKDVLPWLDESRKRAWNKGEF